MTRPNAHDVPVLIAAVEALLPEIITWLGADYREAERGGLVKQLCEAIKFETDGYRIASTLERHYYWECDSQLVEILNGAWGRISDAHNEALREWVTAERIVPRFAVGDAVNVNLKFKGAHQGPIVKIDSEHGRYGVTVAALGQTYDAQTGLGAYYLVDFEKAETGSAGNVQRSQPSGPAPKGSAKP